MGKGIRWEQSRGEHIKAGAYKVEQYIMLIGKHSTGLCEVCGVNEMVEHVIIHCRKYTVEQYELKDELVKKGEQFTIRNVLNPEAGRNISLLLQYVRGTGLYKHMSMWV